MILYFKNHQAKNEADDCKTIFCEKGNGDLKMGLVFSAYFVGKENSSSLVLPYFSNYFV